MRIYFQLRKEILMNLDVRVARKAIVPPGKQLLVAVETVCHSNLKR